MPKPANDSCAAAAKLTFSGAAASALGDASLANNTMTLPYGNSCTNGASVGPDLFYSVTLTGGKVYTVKLNPDAGYNAAVYVLSGCGNPATACLCGSNDAWAGSAEQLVFYPQTTGSYIIGVDSSYPFSSSDSRGKFTLDVAELPVSPGDSCNKPLALTWSCGKAVVTGDTSKATNTIKFAGAGCPGGAGGGPELFYSVHLTANKTYNVLVTPTGASSTSYDIAAYAFTSCGDPAGSCLGGVDSGFNGTAEKFVVTPKSSGPQIIAVDGRHYAAKGTFSLEVSEAGTSPPVIPSPPAVTAPFGWSFDSDCMTKRRHGRLAVRRLQVFGRHQLRRHVRHVAPVRSPLWLGHVGHKAQRLLQPQEQPLQQLQKRRPHRRQPADLQGHHPQVVDQRHPRLLQLGRPLPALRLGRDPH